MRNKPNFPGGRIRRNIWTGNCLCAAWIDCGSEETKPIRRWPIADCGLRMGYRVAEGRPACGPLPASRGGRWYETKPMGEPGIGGQMGGAWYAPYARNQSCQTKPIGRQGTADGDTRDSRIPSFHDSNRMPIVRNKPNSQADVIDANCWS